MLLSRKAGQAGRLRIGASTTPGLYLLPPILRRFTARRPEVDVRYSVENSRHIEEKIVRNELDVGCVGAHLTHAALQLKPPWPDDVAWYAAASPPLIERRRPVLPRDLASERCFVREPGSATRRLVDAWLHKARVRLEKTTLIGCPEAAKVLVRAGVGVSYMSAAGLVGPGSAGLRRLPIPSLRLTRPIYLVLHADKRLAPPLRAFLEDVESATAGASPAA